MHRATHFLVEKDGRRGGQRTFDRTEKGEKMSSYINARAKPVRVQTQSEEKTKKKKKKKN